MPKLRVHSFGMSIDGYGAGPTQSLENPLGVGGLALHEWAFKTRTFHAMVGEDGGETGVDDDFVARGGVRRCACPDGISRWSWAWRALPRFAGSVDRARCRSCRRTGCDSRC